ncbi:MAG: EAL domain-containing protein [Thermodesulfobacterium sp.]|nr:EAL domain-containing protein [Thermodesulfobacterium sp.]
MNSAKYFEIFKIKELQEILLRNPFIGILIYREKCIYANHFICKLLEYTQEEFSQLKIEDIVYFEEDKKRVREIAKRRPKGEQFLMAWKDIVLRTKRDKKVYALVSSITILYEGKPSGLLMIIDITKKVRIEKLLKMWREINQKLVEADSEKKFFDKIGKILTNVYGMKFVWVGAPDYETKLIKPVYSFGAAINYLKEIKVSMEKNVPEGMGPTGRAFRENKIQIIADTKTDPRFIPWRKPASKFGLRSVAAIPIKIEDKIKYVFTLYADEPFFFEEENREILEELRRDLEFGIKKLELCRREKIFAETLKNLEEIVISLNQEGTILFINEKGSRILGFSQDELIEKPIEILGFKFKGENLANLFKAGLDKPLRIPVSIETSKGTLWFDMKIRVIRPDEETLRYILIAEDVSKILEFEDMLDKARYVDFLTKLLNYEGFRKEIENVLPFVSEEGALIIVDLCDFTYINTMFGHEGGNFCLEEIARRLEFFKNKGLVSRAFSDTFVVFFYHLKDKRQIFEILKTLKNLISEPIKLRNKTLKIDFNAGVAIFPQDGKNFEKLWKNANLALNEAKRKGKGAVEFYSYLISEKLDFYFKSESLIKRAFEEGLFVFYYQPYFDVNTLKIAGLEALIRIKEKDGTIYLPSEFLEYLENSSYLKDFEKWGIKTLKEKILKWEVPINFNISGKSSNLDHVKKLINRFRSKQFFSNLVIEITERVIVQNVEEIKEMVKFLKSKGIKVALDDFGIGYSSLSYLKDIPFDILKIDRIFIKEMLKSRKEIALVKNMIDIGHSFDMKVLAEGVETKEQLQYLDIMGCDYVQGFYLAKPMLEEEVEELLTTKTTE